MSERERYLFEVSWEVCNKVGGIYTVIRSKAVEAMNEFGDDGYLTIGPMLVSNPEFEAEDDPFFSDVSKVLETKNITLQYGRWNIEGKPRCLLVGFQHAFPQHDKLLFGLWEDFGVDSMFGSWEYIEPILFSTACGMVIEEISKRIDAKNTFAHFHEWMAGAGMLHLKKNAPDICTVFTTHATILGRAMSGSGIDIYANLDEIDAAVEAKRHNISAKYSMESVCAREADCFTAVSEITGRECRSLLGTEPDIITPNGFNVADVKDYSKDSRAFLKQRKAMLEFATAFLNEDLGEDNTKLISISGRYEFHNKGIDVLVESLSNLNNELKSQNTDLKIVCLFLVIGGNVGVRKETRLRLHHALAGIEQFSAISTHHLGDEQNDPILKSCRQFDLMNKPDDRCNVILVPVYLDGNDGVINRSYYDVLAGCDAGIYPSNYEPWGYTPLESVAFAVPAVTTDKAGFGIWVKEHIGSDKPGVAVIDRYGHTDSEAVDSLTGILRSWAHWDKTEKEQQKKGARQIAEQATWEKFFSHYREAYTKAQFSKEIRLAGIQEEGKELRKVFAGTNSIQPRLRSFSIVSELPERIKKLRVIAYNLWWSWNQPARELFSRLDPALWNEMEHNPVALLEQIDGKKLTEAAENENYLARYDVVVKTYEEYINRKDSSIPDMKNISNEDPVAYFSMECGIHESIPTYSGGLGVLSGDHLKSASDLNIPLAGVTLLYKYGYFRQRITKMNEQVCEYNQNDFAGMPVDVVRGENGERLIVSVDFPGRIVKAQVWKADVGRVALYFLDTDIEENAVKDREITDRLYDSETRERIEQEILLGLGGVKLLKGLDITPALFHLNEGHSAFLIIERIVALMKDEGLDFDTAKEVVRASTVFTTHTPVSAGNERFDKALIENYFRNYVQQAGISWDQFWTLGHIYAGDESAFDMTVCALKSSFKRNAVSRLHGKVAREMWQKLWNGFLIDEIPIDHITNGVHVPSWMADEMKHVVETYGGVTGDRCSDVSAWKKIDDIPDEKLWKIHKTLKNKLFDRIAVTIQKNWTREGVDPGIWNEFRKHLNPDALTLGFARRFAQYKRPTLILKDMERLKQFIASDKTPVQFIFAGKAHPADRAGADMIREIVRLSKTDEFIGRLIFLEDYNIDMARLLVSGVDIWLNNPVRFQEASGTSGMKACLNGVINCSIPDGWWDEAFDGSNGFAIGRGVVYENAETQSLVDADNLYSLLEEQIVPGYYRRDKQGIPAGWVQLMKNAIRTVTPVFNTHRMLADYVSLMYEPTAERYLQIQEKEFSTANKLAEWKKKLAARFSTLHIKSMQIDGIHGDVGSYGSRILVRVIINKGDLSPEDILPEFIVQNSRGTGTEPFHFIARMKLVEKRKNLLTFETEFQADCSGKFKYGVRVMPYHTHLGSKYENSLIVWG